MTIRLKDHEMRFGRTATFLAGILLYNAGVMPAAAATETVLWSFTGGADGAKPYAGLYWNSRDGYLYGAASAGGANGQGTVFKMPPSAGQPYTAYSFAGYPNDGAAPYGTPIVDPAGLILGTTTCSYVNSNGCQGVGNVYQLTPNPNAPNIYSETDVYAFANASGANPRAGLTSDGASTPTFYGTTTAGGSSGDGVIFKVYKNQNVYSWASVYSFVGGSSNGVNPYGGVFYYGGSLYGTTLNGGSTSYEGTLYKLPLTSQTPTFLNAFQGTNGAYPYGGVVVINGNIFGTTTFYGSGSTSGQGLVFEYLSPSLPNDTLHAFTGTNNDGAAPWASLYQDPVTGNVYGTTTSGGQYGQGSLFGLIKANGYSYSQLYSFRGGTADGANPYGPVTTDGSGNVYGTTVSGGSDGKGVVFKYTP